MSRVSPSPQGCTGTQLQGSSHSVFPTPAGCCLNLSIPPLLFFSQKMLTEYLPGRSHHSVGLGPYYRKIGRARKISSQVGRTESCKRMLPQKSSSAMWVQRKESSEPGMLMWGEARGQISDCGATLLWEFTWRHSAFLFLFVKGFGRC